MPQHVPSPACCLLRGDWKHLFIILCIIDHSEILITSFPQDCSEMVCLIIIGGYPVLRTLDSYLSTLSDFPRPPFHCSFPSTCFGQGQCYRRRKATGHAYMTSVMKIPLLIITIFGPNTLNLKIYISYQGQGFRFFPYFSRKESHHHFDLFLLRGLAWLIQVLPCRSLVGFPVIWFDGAIKLCFLWSRYFLSIWMQGCSKFISHLLISCDIVMNLWHLNAVVPFGTRDELPWVEESLFCTLF